MLAAVWGLKLAKVARSTSATPTTGHDLRADPAKLLYVALGDSAAQSIGARRPERGYVGLLAQRLRDSSGHRVQVVNLSRSGARMHDVIDSQIPALAALGRTLHIMTVAIGGNDISQYDRAAVCVASDRLTSALPSGTYVADVPYFMHGHWERQARQAARMLTTSAAANGLGPVALHEALESQGLRAMLNQYAADWFHPNDRGHRVWAGAF